MVFDQTKFSLSIKIICFHWLRMSVGLFLCAPLNNLKLKFVLNNSVYVVEYKYFNLCNYNSKTFVQNMGTPIILRIIGTFVLIQIKNFQKGELTKRQILYLLDIQFYIQKCLYFTQKVFILKNVIYFLYFLYLMQRCPLKHDRVCSIK